MDPLEVYPLEIWRLFIGHLGTGEMFGLYAASRDMMGIVAEYVESVEGTAGLLKNGFVEYVALERFRRGGFAPYELYHNPRTAHRIGVEHLNPIQLLDASGLDALRWYHRNGGYLYTFHEFLVKPPGSPLHEHSSIGLAVKYNYRIQDFIDWYRSNSPPKGGFECVSINPNVSDSLYMELIEARAIHPISAVYFASSCGRMELVKKIWPCIGKRMRDYIIENISVRNRGLADELLKLDPDTAPE